MHYFLSKGLNPFYLKPFQTGVQSPGDPDGDASFIYRHIDQLKAKDPSESSPYCFPQPKAPLPAAKSAGVSIDMKKIETIVEEKKQTYSPLIVEGAGGLLVPITDDLLCVDLIGRMQAETILVARAGLGTINHTLLSVESLVGRGLKPAMIVFVDCSPDRMPRQLITENMQAVEAFSGIRVCGVIDRIADFSQVDPKHLLLFDQALTECS
jgi:dethiobiotin synthetase